MSDPIYLIPDGSAPIPLEPKAYTSEEEFQDLLELFPQLLAGEQVDRDSPRRWLLVAREMGIPDSSDTSSRWSLDHFFVDQDGVPTLVEVKRQSDSRLRREVVGQMLDYAANASRYWPASLLERSFAETCAEKNADPGTTLAAFLNSPEVVPERFWRGVESRLAEGDMRLVFVADVVPSELQRIVEFLNSQTKKTEVLAIEVRRYSGGGFSTHVPRLFGQTTEAQDAKVGATTQSRRKWDADSFFAAAATLRPDVQNALRQLYTVATEPGFSLRWGTGSANGTFSIIVDRLSNRSVFSLLSNGQLWANAHWLPEEAQASLLKFAEQVFEMEPREHWTRSGVIVPPERWVRRVPDMIAYLRRLAVTGEGPLGGQA